MKIIDTATRRGSGHNMHRITVEFADGRKASAIIYREIDREIYISLVAACKIAGVSEDLYRKFLKAWSFKTPYATVPARLNGTMQARKMVFTAAYDMTHFLKCQGDQYDDIRAWFATMADSPLDVVVDFDGAVNPVEAKCAGILSTPVDESTPAAAAPVTPVHIDFDGTGGIEQLNRVVSSLDVPYQVRARALSIQNEFSRLAKVVETLNTTGKAA